MKHNNQMEEEKAMQKGDTKISGDMLNTYTDVSQKRDINSKK